MTPFLCPFFTWNKFLCFHLYYTFVAVLLENFSIFYNEDDTELNHAVVRDYKLNWLYYDKKATVSPRPLLLVPTPAVSPYPCC